MSWCDRDGEITKKPQHADSDCIVAVARQLAFAQNAIQCHLNSLFTLYFKFHYFIRSGNVCLAIVCRSVRTLDVRRDRFLWVFWKYNEIALMLSAVRWCDCNTRCRSDVVWSMCGHCVAVVVNGKTQGPLRPATDWLSECERASASLYVQNPSRHERRHNTSVYLARDSRVEHERRWCGGGRLYANKSEIMVKQKTPKYWNDGEKNTSVSMQQTQNFDLILLCVEVWGARFSILFSLHFFFFQLHSDGEDYEPMGHFCTLI